MPSPPGARLRRTWPAATGQLGSALDALTGLGAKEPILYVDDDAPPGEERDRTAANRLYESAGFTEIDRLYSYALSS
ncbi:hypothetical protein AR457_38430 [Streptomyces agglomeratus]|uniref:GNAT family N-acetyltransferase n=1 Tax=Streptomyces agglomeratus TaxID=285458 RepID=UPI00085462E0|nr:hypothetical protein [Streptomyces agglomeratus]OEJ23066.1 hypothetical protein AR457_38430 [Streptomyces agglomeratus]